MKSKMCNFIGAGLPNWELRTTEMHWIPNIKCVDRRMKSGRL